MPDAVYGAMYDIAGLQFQDCLTCGASVTRRNFTQHTNFHLTFTNRRDLEVSTVKWCDYGDHAFKNGQPGSGVFDGTEYDEEGLPHKITMDACAEHNPMNIQRAAAKYSITTEAYRAVTNDHHTVDRGE